MAITPTAIIMGNVVRVSERTVPNKTDPKKPWVFRNILVIGEHCIADIRVGDQFTLPKAGEAVNCRVGLSSYRNDAELELEEWL